MSADKALFRLAIDVPKSLLLKSNGSQGSIYANTSKSNELRRLGCIMARRLRLEGPVGERIDLLTVVRYPRRTAKADAPNLYPTVKHLEDGLVDAGVLVDDSYQYIRRHAFQVGEPTGRPGVWQVVVSGHRIKEE
ncbi:RusA family crossover junction endodeoxyribonuclease [Bifidobacterium xylocopae]|uniref:Uncharacterized protein n=1 Tax=Bifidobacterium xylocopae TaxID=2493119 RepID=A0A366KEA2_9BIFI|nr:hypothetical protein [Bifidobacterium xylocopae]RBQ00047.1 hypothetical protein CRD59_00875 [Bifidobacterium xylocopae]